MGLFDFWRTRSELHPADADAWVRLGAVLPTTSGVTVTAETAMRLTTVYACVRLLSESVAGLPLQTFSKLGQRRSQHTADPWINRPNREYTRFRFWQEMMVGLLLDGNGLAKIERTPGGRITGLWPLWSPSVGIDRDESGYRRYLVNGGYLTDYEVLHVQGLTLPGHARALSPVGDYVAKNSVGLGLAAEQYAAAVYANDATPGGYIKAPSIKDQDEADRLKERWLRSHQGTGHTRAPAVLGGDAEFVQVAFDPEATQLVEARGFQVEEICRIYGVPPHMVASVERSTSWGAGIEQQSIQWVSYSLRPWLERIEQAINPLLTRPAYVNPEAEVFCRFNVEGLLRGDIKSRMEAYAVGIQTGIYTPNRCLALEDEPPYEGGDRHYMPLNMYAVEDGRETAAD